MPSNANFNSNIEVLWEGATHSSTRGVVGATPWKLQVGMHLKAQCFL